MPTKPEFSIVTESYNLTEGAGIDSLRRSLASASEATGGERGEVLLADVDGRPEIDEVLREFPLARKIDCRGLSYDAAKNRAIEAARGEFVAFLDGDCLPDPGWLDHLLGPLRSNQAYGTCGYTSYTGGFWAAVQTLMDFGFLLPLRSRPVGCYASNNWAVRRSELITQPIPDTEILRCSCYLHAQALLQRGTPLELVPDATAHHDLPPFWAERWRRGYDVVAACWGDPAPPESRLLRYGLLAAPRFYWDNVRLDWRRLRENRRELGLSRIQALLAGMMTPLLRWIDLVGIVQALLDPRSRPTAALDPIADSR